MARSIRTALPGAFYPVMAGGNRREEILMRMSPCGLFPHFPKPVGGGRVHACTLMGNHPLIEKPESNEVAGMGW